MTRDEFEIKVWQEYYEECVRFHDLTPRANADRLTAQRMRHEAIRNLPAWEMPEPEGAGE